MSKMSDLDIARMNGEIRVCRECGKILDRAQATSENRETGEIMCFECGAGFGYGRPGDCRDFSLAGPSGIDSEFSPMDIALSGFVPF